MVITMRTELVALFVIRHVLTECLLAFFAYERHLGRPHQWMRLGFGVALGTVEPFLAAGRSDGNLSV